jgi:ATP-binding cassette subfamily B (MDR/TAP) protein 1
MDLASDAVVLIVSFMFMWPFALLALGILPCMAFGAKAEMKMYMEEDGGATCGKDVDVKSLGDIVV